MVKGGCTCPKWCRLSELRIAPSGIILGQENPEYHNGYQFIVMVPTDYALPVNRNLPSMVYAKHLNGWYLGTGNTAQFDADCRSLPSYKVNAQIFFCPWCGSPLTPPEEVK